MAHQDLESDGKSIEDLYAEMHEPIYRYAHSRVSDPTDAEDITSQAFLHAVRWYDPDRTAAEGRSWLFQIARSVVGEHWRRHYRSGNAIPLTDLLAGRLAAPTETAKAASSESEGRVEQVLEELPERYRNVLKLRFLQGASLQETAESLSVTVANAKVLQHRALRRAALLGHLISSPPQNQAA